LEESEQLMFKKDMQKETQEKIERLDNHLGIHLGDYLYVFILSMFIIIGIKDLQSKHYFEENYQYVGWYYIIFGLLGIYIIQRNFKRRYKK